MHNDEAFGNQIFTDPHYTKQGNPAVLHYFTADIFCQSQKIVHTGLKNISTMKFYALFIGCFQAAQDSYRILLGRIYAE